MKIYLTTREAAELLGNTKKTLEQWRYLGKGPPYYTTPTGRIRYRSQDISAWIMGGQNEE